MFKPIPLVSVIAKRSHPHFALRDASFVVPLHGEFHYFTCEVGPDTGRPILWMKKTPPLLREGYVIAENNVYLVTVDDIRRRVVRKSRLINIAEEKNSDGTPRFPTAAQLANQRRRLKREQERRERLAMLASRATEIQRETGEAGQRSTFRDLQTRSDECGLGTDPEMEFSEGNDSAFDGQVEALRYLAAQEAGDFDDEWEVQSASDPQPIGDDAINPVSDPE